MRSRLILTLLLLSLSLAHAHNRALIVNVSQYQNPKNNLPGNVFDTPIALDLAVRLGFTPEDTLLLQDAQATRKNILAALNAWVVDGVQEDDRVFIYYSGHGTQVPDETLDEDDGCDEAIVPHDGQVIVDDEIYMALQRIPARDVMLVFDSCFSGTVTRTLTLSPEGPTPDLKSKYLKSTGQCNRPINDPKAPQFLPTTEKSLALAGRDFIEFSASAHNEISWSTPRGSLFSRMLLETLQENPQLTFAELQVQVNDRVHQFTEQASITPQTPTLTLPDRWRNQKLLDFGHLAVLPERPAPPNTTVLTSATLQDLLQVLKAQSQFGVDVQASKRQYKIGEALNFQVSSTIAGHLNLLEVSSSGTLTLIYPNSARQNNRIPANTPFTIPGDAGNFRFRAAPPIGKETLLALVTTEPLNLYTENLGVTLGGFKTFTPTELEALKGTLAHKTLNVQPTTGGLGANYLTFTIVP